MITLHFEVDKDHLAPVDFRRHVTSGIADYAELVFSFDRDWEPLTKTVLFFNASQEKRQVPLSGNSCVVPRELVQEPGELSFGLAGVKGSQRVTTNIFVIKVTQGAYTQGQTPPPPTADVYQQILNRI